jgi:hypothetical protein
MVAWLDHAHASSPTVNIRLAVVYYILGVISWDSVQVHRQQLRWLETGNFRFVYRTVRTRPISGS